MIISCTHLDLNTTHEVLARQVQLWLKSKRYREGLDSIGIQDGEVQLAPGHKVKTHLAMTGWPQRAIVRHTQPDSDIEGRYWITDISWEQSAANTHIHCSVKVEIVAESTDVQLDDISPSVPRIVGLLIENACPTPNSAGAAPLLVHTLDEVGDLLDWIRNPSRRDAIVVISPMDNTGGEYLCPPIDIARKLAGLAKTYCLTPIQQTTLYRMNDCLGDAYRVFGGAIRVIYPQSVWNGEKRISTFFWRKDELDAAEIGGTKAPDFIFKQVNERMRKRNTFRHITPDMVRELQHAQETERLRHALREKADQSEDQQSVYDALLESAEEERDREKSRADSLQGELEHLSDQLEVLSDENRQLKKQVDELETSLNYHPDAIDDATLPNQVINIMREVVSEQMTPYTTLKFIESCWPARVFIHQRAWDSSEDSKKFNEPSRLFNLLWILVTDYWADLVKGIGDAQARKHFGKSYSAKESERASKNDKARKLRTIDYKGHPFTVFPHLKIGVDESAEGGIRVHFDWDAIDKKIVIGYCGKHLDLR